MQPNDRHRAFLADLKTAMKPYADLSAAEMLAIVSQLVGNLIALQDQRTMTPDRAMAIVAGNIEIGNQEALRELLGPAAGSA